MNRNITNSNINRTGSFYKTTNDIVKYTQPVYNKTKDIYNKTPITIRVLNVIIPFILTFYFTIISFNLSLSVTFAFITFIFMLIYNWTLAVIFIVLYTTVVINSNKQSNKIIGNPIPQTNILQNNTPYNCAGNSLTVQSSWFPKDTSTGYFSYSFWFYVKGNQNDINKDTNWNNYRYNEWKSIFYRGSSIDTNDQDLSTLIQFPGFWLTPKMNNLVIVFQNNSHVERLEINNIEFNKWNNVIVVVEMKSVSVYMNGLLDRTLNLYQNVSLMNNYNLYISGDKKTSSDKKKSGFPGYIANLTYYNYALSVNDIITIYNYYKEIIDKYQNKLLSNYKPNNNILITNNMNKS